MVVSPWGEVLAKAGAGEEIVNVTIDFSELEERRRAMPLAQQRRIDLYDLIDRHA